MALQYTEFQLEDKSRSGRMQCQEKTILYLPYCVHVCQTKAKRPDLGQRVTVKNDRQSKGRQAKQLLNTEI